MGVGAEGSRGGRLECVGGHRCFTLSGWGASAGVGAGSLCFGKADPAGVQLGRAAGATQAMYVAARLVRQPVAWAVRTEGQAAEQSLGVTKALMVVVAAPPAGCWALTLIAESTDGSQWTLWAWLVAWGPYPAGWGDTGGLGWDVPELGEHRGRAAGLAYVPGEALHKHPWEGLDPGGSGRLASALGRRPTLTTDVRGGTGHRLFIPWAW